FGREAAALRGGRDAMLRIAGLDARGEPAETRAPLVDAAHQRASSSPLELVDLLRLLAQQETRMAPVQPMRERREPSRVGLDAPRSAALEVRGGSREAMAPLGAIGHGELGRLRRRGRTQIRGELGDREIRLVADADDDRNADG